LNLREALLALQILRLSLLSSVASFVLLGLVGGELGLHLPSHFIHAGFLTVE